MGLKFLGFLILSLVSAEILDAAAASIHSINGYTVIIADVKKGNSTRIQLHTPNGSFHDPVELAGIAHYTEHMMFNGTPANPRVTLGRLLSDIGAENNASTSFLSTTYYSNQHESRTLQALQYWGQAFSNPLFENAITELETVTREIDGDALNDDGFLTAVSAFSLVFPEGHPLGQTFFGTQKELSRITVADVKRIFWSHAGPGGLTILVSGNFSSSGAGHITKDQVLESIRQHFAPPEIPAGSSLYTRGDLQTFPVYSNEGSLPFIRIRSQDTKRVLTLNFLSNSPWANRDYQAREVLIDFLNLDAPGTLARELKDAGLVTDIGVSETTNLKIEATEFTAVLTKKGYQNLDDVMNRFWNYLSKIRAYGIPELLLQLVVEDLQSQLDEAELSAETFAGSIKTRLFLGAKEAVRLSHPSAWTNISNARIISATSQFIPEQTIVSISAADAREDSEHFVSKVGGADEAKKREAYRRDTTGTIARWNKILKEPQSKIDPGIHVVDHRVRGAKPLDLPPQVARKISDTSDRDGVEVYLEENHEVSKAGTIVRLQLPLLTAKDQAYLEILVRGFQDRYAAELSYFALKNFSGGIQVGTNQILVIGKGDSLGGLDFIKWVFEKLASYIPNREEIRKAKQEVSDEASSFLQARSTKIAFTSAHAHLLESAPTKIQINAAAAQLTDDEILTYDRRFLTAGDFIVSGSGDLTERELNGLVFSLRDSIPNPLSTKIRARVAESLTRWPNPSRTWIRLDAPKSENDFGYVRVIRIHGRSAQDLAMGEVLGKMLDTSIYEHNRETQALGYAHEAGLSTLRGEPHLMLYGGVDPDDAIREVQRTGFDKFGLMREGVKHVILGLVGKSPVPKLNWTDEQIAKLIRGLIANFSQSPTDPVEAASELLTGVMRTRDVQARERIAAELEKITPDQVRTAAEKQVLTQPYWEFAASAPSEEEKCLNVLATLD